MSTNRPTRTACITAIVATAALVIATLIGALAAFEHGQYRHHPRPHHTQAEIHEMERLEHALAPAHDGLDDGKPVEMPGRVPGRGGWVSEEGVSSC